MAYNERLTHKVTGNTAGVMADIVTGSVVFAGGANITLSQDANTVSIIGGAGAGGGIANAAGTQTATSGTVVFSNSNGITFGMSNSSIITASYNSTQFQTTGNYLTTAMASNRGSDFVQATAAFAGTNATGTIASNGISVSVNPQTAYVFSNSNGVSFGTNGSTVTATVKTDYLTSQSNQAVSGANGSFTFQTLSVANSNGLSWSTGTQGLYGTVKTDYAASDHSHGNPTLALTNLSGTTASNSNGLTLSLSAAAAGAGGFQSAGFSTQGNTSGDTGFASQSIQFVGGNNITLSGSTGAGGLTVTISGANAGGAQTGISGIQVSDTTYSSGTVIWKNANGISFGASGANGISASYTVPTQSVQPVAISGSNGSFTFSTATFGNLNGLSFYTSNGSFVGSHNALTTARASTDAVGLNTALTAGPLAWTVNSSGISLNAGSAAGTTSGFGGNLISGSMTHNTAGLNLSLNHPAWLTTAMQSNAVTLSNIRVSAGTTSNLLSAITFSNSNGLTFGLNAGTMTASHNGLTTAAQSDHSHGNPTLNLTNLSGTTASDSAGFTLSLSAGAGGGVTPVASASNGSFSFTTLGFSNANNVTFGTSAGGIITASVAAPGAAAENNWFNLLGANTAGNTTASGSTLGLSGINLTLSGTNGSVMNISAPAVSSLVGTGGVTLSTNGSTISIGRAFQSEFVPFIAMSTASQTLAALGATSASARFFPMDLSDNIAFNVLSLMHNFSYATSSVSGQQTISYLYGLYSNNAGSLSLISSNSFSFAVTNSSVSHTVSYPVSTGTAGYTYTTLAQTTTANIQSFWGTGAGGRVMGLQFGNSMTLSSGDYWLGLLLRHSSSSANIGVSIGLIGNANAVHNNLAGIGQASSAQTTNYSIRYGQRGLGAYTVSQSTLPNGVPLSQIAHTQTIMPLYSFLST